jgi:phosphoglycerate dehydrogenase-like enzyme
MTERESITVLFANVVPSDDAVFNEHRIRLRQWADGAAVGGARVELLLPDRGEEGLVDSSIAGTDVLVLQDGHIDASMLERARRLRLIHVIGTRGASVDLEAATRLGVPVAMVPHFGCVVVAEHSIMMMLALRRRLLPLHERTARGENPRNLPTITTSQWQRHFNWLGLADDELGSLYGQTLAIVGLGEIGTEVAKRARAFGMEVLYTKRSRLSASDERELDVTFGDLPDLLARADVVTIHCSHNDATDRLIDERALATMKRTALLINTARGGIVAQEALEDALLRGLIAGAGLDVFAEEPLAPNSGLAAAPNVILSPHVAARAPVLGRYVDLIENLERLVGARKPKGLLNPEVLRP